MTIEEWFALDDFKKQNMEEEIYDIENGVDLDDDLEKSLNDL